MDALAVGTRDPNTATETPILTVSRLRKKFMVKKGWRRKPLWAVDDVSLFVLPGEILGLVGESGCGKSTLARCIVRLHDSTSGHIVFDGRDITRLSERQLKQYRPILQMVFQDPADALNPRMTVAQLLDEPLSLHTKLNRSQRKERILALLSTVDLNEGHLARYPHQLSTGQQQRVGVARAMSCGPKLVVLDEPTSALDVSVRGRLLRLLQDIRDKTGTSFIFVSHDLSVVRHLCDRTAVMYLGTIVESAPSATLFSDPKHPYTKALIAAIPIPDPRVKRPRTVMRGEVPSPLSIPAGCPFQSRCPIAVERCLTEKPPLREVDGLDHRVACHLA